MGARCAPAFFQQVAEFLATPLGQNRDIKVAGFTGGSHGVLSNGTYQHHIGLISKFLDKIIHHGFTLNLEK